MSLAEGAGARALWAEVLQAAIADARKTGDPSYFRTRDFAEVASLAGIDPEAARHRILAELRGAKLPD